jgi:haloalkane dehalogenase
MAARNRERVHGAVFANTAIRVPSRPPRVTPFHRLSHLPLVSDLVFRVFNFPLPLLHLVQGDRRSIGRAQRRAYRYPLRAFRDRVAPLALARLVPTSLNSTTLRTLEEANEWGRSFTGPVRLVWGTRDPILGPAVHGMKKLFAGAEVVETDGGHFLQEEVPQELADSILAVVGAR